MVGNRWTISVVVAAGLATVPACALHLGSKSSEFPPTDARAQHVSAPQAVSTEFAAYPRRPGEYVPLRADESDAVPVAIPTVEVPPAAVAPEPLPSLAPRVDPPLVAAVREYVNDRPDLAIAHLKGLDAANQELLLQLIPVVVRAGQAPLSKASPHDVGVMAGEVEGAHAALAARSPLFVENVCFCRSVRNYGRYDPFPERHAYRPGALVWLYTEVRNVPSEPADASGVAGYVTKLVCSLQVMDAAGNVVPMPDPVTRQPVPALRDTKEDFTRSPVRDYFIAFKLPVPPTPGEYTVRFEVRDPKSGRAVSKPVSLRVQ